MKTDEFKIEREDDGFLPRRSFTVTAAEYVPDDPSRAVKLNIWQAPSAMSGHTIVNGEFNLSLQERRELIAFLSALPDADHPF